MLDDETRDSIHHLVFSGFYSPRDVVGTVCTEMFSPGEVDRKEVAAAVQTEFDAWEGEKRSWPAVTDWDRLDRAFQALSERGVIALHNAGMTQSDGYDDFRQALSRRRDKQRVRGYCFYHAQDVERAVRGEGLHLAFGPTDARDEETRGATVGEVIRDALTEHGFEVQWNGSFQQRIFLPKFVWQKR